MTYRTLPYYRKRGPFVDYNYMLDLHDRVEKKTLNMYNFMLILRPHNNNAEAGRR